MRMITLANYFSVLQVFSSILLFLLLSSSSLIPNVYGANCHGNISQVEYNALEMIYNHTFGDSWKWNTIMIGIPWQFPSLLSAPCSTSQPWQGITCIPILNGSNTDTNDGLCTVGVLDLRNHRLRGSLPSYIGDLSSLTELHLEMNYLRGTIPTELTYLTRLGILNISSNIVTGSIPMEMGTSMRNLSILELGNNLLSGSIPTSFIHLTKLDTLILQHNLLTGDLTDALNSIQLSQLKLLDLASNPLNGTIPSSIASMVSIQQLYLDGTPIVGTIPTLLCSLVTLEVLALGGANGLTGTLPSCLVNLTALLSFEIVDAAINGSIPASLFQMSNLLILDIETTFMSGSLLGMKGVNMPSLQVLTLTQNNLKGSIPSEIGLLTNLTALYLDMNSFTGCIPSTFGQLSFVNQMALGLNDLGCSVPAEFGNMTSMRFLNLAGNNIGGLIPIELGRLTKLVEIEFSSNQFTGLAPAMFENLTELIYLYLNNNFLSGPIGSLLKNSTLKYLNLGYNLFTGPLLETSEFIVEVEYIANSNFFTGVISPSILQLTRLETFEIGTNMFTGTVPTEIGSFDICRAITLNSNYFTGSFPSTIYGCKLLESLEVSANYLTGTLPRELGDLARLQSMNMSKNILTGRIEHIFGPGSKLYFLSYLDLSQNQLTGSIPSNLFAVPHLELMKIPPLEAVILYQNCFTGTLPDSICQAGNLTALVMDAASCASSCCNPFGAVLISRAVFEGSIPDCIWSLPSLQTLHLSGNAIGGELGNLPAVSVIDDIDLSNNKIVGTLPLSWQMWGKFVHLDVANNKLTGTLTSEFQIGDNNDILDLTGNRISGTIPPAFRQAPDVNILDGNLFQCSSDSLPENDPNRDEYVCSSSDFNDALLSWMVLVLMLMVMAILLYRWWKSSLLQTTFNFYDRLQFIGSPALRQTQDILTFVLSMSKWIGYLTVFYLGIVMSLFIIIKSLNPLAKYYSTHTLQYAWITTAAFLHGVIPFVIVCLALCGGICCVSCGLGINLEKPRYQYLYSCSSVDLFGLSSISLQSFRPWMVLTAALGSHIVVAIFVNVLYVYSIIYGLNASTLTWVQFALSIFKLSWNNFFIVRTLQTLPLQRSNRLFCSVFVYSFSFLVSPLIATFFSDTTCFRDFISGEPHVVSSFYAKKFECRLECADILDDIECHSFCGMPPSSNTLIFTTVAPSWLYSYQCSSSLITNYVPVLLFAYMISGVAIPIAKVCFVGCSDVLLEQTMPSWILKHISKTVFAKNVRQLYVASEVEASPMTNRTAESKFDTSAATANFVEASSLEIPTKHESFVFNAVALASKVCLNLAVLLTFGLASPLLAIAVALDSWTYLFSWRLATLEYLNLHYCLDEEAKVTFSGPSQSFVVKGWDRLELAAGQFTNEGNALLKAFFVIVATAGIFWSMLVFDMIGDVYGPSIGGLSVIVPAAGAPLSLIFSLAYNGYTSSSFESNSSIFRPSELYRTSFSSPTDRMKSTVSISTTQPSAALTSQHNNPNIKPNEASNSPGILTHWSSL